MTEKAQEPKTETKSKSVRPSSIPQSLDLYVRQLKSLATALPPAMSALGKAYHHQAKELDEFIDKHAVAKRKAGGETRFRLSDENVSHFESRASSVESYALAIRNVPITFIVSLVSQFDALVGNLLRNAFYLKPDMLKASLRPFTFAELIEFKNVESAREHLIEKEVESVLRSSHSDHFEWMESRFGMPLRKELRCWPNFIEITERRNLFVHCDGVVSSQYLSVCKLHGANASGVKQGDTLDVTPEYFSAAYGCLFELGVKLGHVLWRKLCPDDLEAADNSLIEVGFDLLKEEEFSLAKEILGFGTRTLKKHSSDIVRRVLIVNMAIALKALKDQTYEKMLADEDWSACREDFQLAVAVLMDREAEAIGVMKSIGRKGKPSEAEYKTWPLFRDFRKTDVFKKTFRQIFSKDLVIEEKTEAPEQRKSREQAAGAYALPRATKP